MNEQDKLPSGQAKNEQSIKLPLEIQFEILNWLSVDEYFQLRSLERIPFGLHDVVHSNTSLYTFLCRYETHDPSESARPLLKTIKYDEDELRDREKLYWQHRKGYPCRQLFDKPLVFVKKDGSVHTDRGSVKLLRGRYFGYSSYCIGQIYIHDLLSGRIVHVRAYMRLANFMMSDEVVAFTNDKHLYVESLDKLFSSADPESRDAREWKKVEVALQCSFDYLAYRDKVVLTYFGSRMTGICCYDFTKDELIKEPITDFDWGVKTSRCDMNLMLDGAGIHIVRWNKKTDGVCHPFVIQDFSWDVEFVGEWHARYHDEHEPIIGVTTFSNGTDDSWHVEAMDKSSGRVSIHDLVINHKKRTIEKMQTGRIFKDRSYDLTHEKIVVSTRSIKIGDIVLKRSEEFTQKPELPRDYMQDMLLFHDTHLIHIYGDEDGETRVAAFTFDESLQQDGRDLVHIEDVLGRHYWVPSS